MDKETALKELRDCLDYDPEGAHSWADHVLCEFLIHLGHNDVVEAWKAISPKWYA